MRERSGVYVHAGPVSVSSRAAGGFVALLLVVGIVGSLLVFWPLAVALLGGAVVVVAVRAARADWRRTRPGVADTQPIPVVRARR